MLSRSQPELIQLATLALWLGAAAFFSAAVAPALFSALPSRTLAGEVVGRLLPAVFYSGMIVGLLVIATQLQVNTTWNWRGRESAAGVMIAACVVAQLIVAPRIERVRAQIGGPIEILSVDDPRRVAFGRLHGASVAWLGVAMLAAAFASFLAARALNAAGRNMQTL